MSNNTSDEYFQFSNSVGNKSENLIINIGDCLTFIQNDIVKGQMYDAIVMDPPYEISLHAMKWDNTGIAFSEELWTSLYDVLKPGGFIVSFAASRLYHRLAIAAENANFTVYPMLTWQFPQGLPKPVNLSELFDRDNIKDRKQVGSKTGSGFTSANAKHGAQQRLTTDFKSYERGVSPEAKEWLGYYYGVNCFKPNSEPILLAQKPISEKRMIDNIRVHGVGALNLGSLKEKYGEWPVPVLKHAKAKAKDHGSNHPSVKPVSLMLDLCELVCPPAGHILDPFAGTGTTGVAALSLGYYCTLMEQNPEMENVIRRRCGIETE